MMLILWQVLWINYSSQAEKEPKPLRRRSFPLEHHSVTLHIHLLQSVHQSSQLSQSLQVATSLVGHLDEAMKGVVHPVIEFRGRGEGSPVQTQFQKNLSLHLHYSMSQNEIKCNRKKRPLKTIFIYWMRQRATTVTLNGRELKRSTFYLKKGCDVFLFQNLKEKNNNILSPSLCNHHIAQFSLISTLAKMTSYVKIPLFMSAACEKT